MAKSGEIFRVSSQNNTLKTPIFNQQKPAKAFSCVRTTNLL